MITKYPYLKDSQFLLNFFKEHNSEQLVKITVLNFKDKPIKEIQGIVTDGNISINGNSAIRRTANLSVFIQEKDASYIEIGGYFSINKKISIDIGIINNSNYYTDYNILWFPIGVYVIINPSISHSDTGTSVSLQLKDKMCLLNGECGGVIPAAVDFHEYEVYDPLTGNYVLERPTLIQIIRELVNHYGHEQLGKIIINDLSSRVKQVMKWTQSTPLYMYKLSDMSYELTLNQKDEDLIKIFEAGMDIGYIYTDFTYPHNSELIGDAGSTVCDILDKIKNVLGNYEYFYDLNGNFVFQEIKNYLNTTKATVDLNNIEQTDYLIDRKNGKAVYVFNDNYIVKSYANSPQYSMIKNDFVVWGLRETANGKKLPIRYHLAIDSKPRVGNTYECFKITHKDPVTNIDTISYKVAVEYGTLPNIGEIERLYQWNNNFYIWNPEDFEIIQETDIESERPTYKYETKDNEGNDIIEYRTHYIKLEDTLQKIITTDWRTELYLSGAMTSRFGNDSNDYYVELANEWPKLYDIENGKFYDDVVTHPNEIDYYLDFIDSDAAISELSISSIGRRTKVINDDNINCIFEQEIPNYILLRAGDEHINTLRAEAIQKGENFIQVDSDIYDTFALGGEQNSAYNMVRDLLYQYTGYNETITVQMLPMYFLTEPNIRITVQDKESGIYGDYMLNNITIPLNINSMMSLSCSRALERI